MDIFCTRTDGEGPAHVKKGKGIAKKCAESFRLKYQI